MALTTEQLTEIGKGLPDAAALREVWGNVLPVDELPAPEETYIEQGAFGAGVDQAQGLGYRFVQMVGDLFDIKELEKLGREG